MIAAAMTSRTSAIGVDIACDKQLTKALLDRAEIPTPRGRIVADEEDAITAALEIGQPVVVKPLDANQGKGVTLNVIEPDDVAQGFRIASRYSRKVIVEEFFCGGDYRVLIVDGKIVAAARREPAQVTADGRRTVLQLIEELNRDPKRGANHGSVLSHVNIDDVVTDTLRKQGLFLDSIPAERRTVRLRENANLSTGGYAVDVTEAVHPEYRMICERAARIVELDICGVDLVVADISEPHRYGGIVEVNAAPGLRMHTHPSEGKPRDVGKAIVDMMYPAGFNGRIPIVSITGTNGKTTVTRLIGHILAAGGSSVGVTTTDGIWIGGKQIAAGDMSGPRSAQVVLSDPAVDIAVLETARGGIVRNGLGYDWSDVGVMTNISADHVGQDGIRSVDDLVRIKALVAERVKPGGVLVLNADDPVLPAVLERPKVERQAKKIVWFSMESSTPRLNDHRTMGGTAYFPRDAWVVEAEGIAERRLIELASIPLTFGGTARFQVANVLAAIAAARAAGCAVEDLVRSLTTFGATQNPGRANLWRTADGYVLFDYGHNTAAIDATAAMLAEWGASRLTAVLSVPGDRATPIIEDAGRAVARRFDRIILREEVDRRGRQAGEVANILAEAIEREHPGRHVQFISDEHQAVMFVADSMLAGEAAVVFCESSKGWDALMRERGASPIDEPDLAYLTGLQRSAHPSRAIA